MTEETALPVTGQPAQEASGQPNADQLDNTNPSESGEGLPEGSSGEEGGETKEQPKAEKTPEERERARMQRGIDRRTRQLAEARAELEMLRQQALTSRVKQGDNTASESDSEPLTLTRQELDEMVRAEAKKLAPTIKEQSAEVERRKGVVQSLSKSWGQERFDELSSDLDDAFGGLTDGSGRPKPAMDAVFEADEPGKVIEFLADPDNAEEASRIASMSAAQAGKAIARLEDKLKAEAAQAKPQPSKLPPPLEAVRGQGGAPKAPDPSNTKAWIAWRNEQERKGMA